MRRYALWGLLSLCLILFGWLLTGVQVARAGFPLQQPTVAIPTVTGTPSGPMVTVTTDQDQINVRAGPDLTYAAIGVLVAGEQAPALGRSPGGTWIQIAYPGGPDGVGWVHSSLVTITPGAVLPIVEPPPLPTPLTTPTIDPTLAAQFVQEVPPTRLPTFTAPPPLVVPAYSDQFSAVDTTAFPMGLVIVFLGAVGLFGTFVSLLRRR